jgi:hypothetical protein
MLIAGDMREALIQNGYLAGTHWRIKFSKEALPCHRNLYGAQVSGYQNTLANQGSVLLSLSQTRHDVEASLHVWGMAQLQEAYEGAIRALDPWVESAPRQGRRPMGKASAMPPR